MVVQKVLAKPMAWSNSMSGQQLLYLSEGLHALDSK